jgi:hypothetical protein
VSNDYTHNIPNIGPRSRYSIVGDDLSWCFQKMATGVVFDGKAPRTAAKNASELDPVVTGGQSIFENLTEGGLFTLLANAKKPLVVEDVYNPGSATVTLVSRDGSVSRALPTAPFKISPNEVIKAVGGTAGSKFGVLVRIDGEKQL